MSEYLLKEEKVVCVALLLPPPINNCFSMNIKNATKLNTSINKRCLTAQNKTIL